MARQFIHNHSVSANFVVKNLLLSIFLLATALEATADSTTSFDFIVIGGGTAGLAVATRITQGLSDASVIVIEAGSDGRADPRISIPGRKGSTIGTQYDWNLTTVPQVNASSRKISMTRGKVLGGSSALNLMTWDRGSIVDYDAWEDLGNLGWNWTSMIRSMLKVETFAPSVECQGGGVGTEGPIHSLINRILPTHQLNFPPTMEILGVQENLASLDGHPIGVARQPSNINGANYTRSYSPEYLKLANSNLFLQLNARVSRINFDSKAATGVTLENGTILTASKEIILSAGSLQSPGLLELSGIGNSDILKAAGIAPIVHDLPGVGENLQDHLRIQSSYQLKPEYRSFDSLRFDSFFAAQQLSLYNAGKQSWYDYTGSGYAFLNWSQVLGENSKSLLAAAAQVANPQSLIDHRKISYLTDPKLSSQVPQVEIIFSDGYTGVKGYPANGTALYGAEFFTLIGAVQHPFALGTVHINSSNIVDQPIIDPKYLSNNYDLQAVAEVAKYLRRIASTAPLSSVWSSEYEPGPAVTTDAQWTEFARNTTLSIYHPVGTCSMLPEQDGGVVSPELKVYGVERLRVVDASIIPMLVSAHIQTAVYGIAERAAEMIVAEWDGR